MRFVGDIAKCVTLHSIFGYDVTKVIIDCIHGDLDHTTNISEMTIAGPSEEMQKYVEAQRASFKENKFAKVSINIELEEEQKDSKVETPLPVSPFVTLCLNC